MKKIRNKIARKIKYYKVGFQQSSREDREFYGVGVFMLIVYLSWILQGMISNAR